MILRNAAVRQGRRTLASPISRSLLRQLSTEVTTETQTDQTWKIPQSATGPPKIVSAARKKQRVVQDGIMSLGTDSAHEHKGAVWTTPHKNSNSATPAAPAQQYAEFKRIQANTRSLGSRVEKRYIPSELVNTPPGPEDITLELLMASQTHMGHSTSLWNPANSRYIYGVRQGIHIISLETTAAHLRRAARVVDEVAYRGGLILFVGTRKGQMEIVTKAAEMAGACHLFTKWTPGSITNRDVILKMAGTKVVNEKDQELDGFERYRGSARPLMPDLVVCLNPLENYTLLYECGLKSIPTIGVIDTNADPSWVTYTIPANDDSLRAMAVVGGVLGRAGQRGQQRRVEDAKKGRVTWQNPHDIIQYMQRENKAAIAERKSVMGRVQHNIEGFSEEEQKILREQFYQDDIQVTEEDMVDMMGEAALGSPKEAEGESTHGARLATIEQQLASLKEEATAIESAVKTPAEAKVESTHGARLADIEQQLAGLKEEATTIESFVKTAPVETAAESTHGVKLAGIEEQLAGVKQAATAIEAEIPGSKKD